MKNKIILLTTLLLVIMTACGGNDSSESTSKEEKEVIQEVKKEKEEKEIVETKEEVKEELKEDKKDEAYEIVYENAKMYKNSIGTTYVQIVFEVSNTGDSPLYLSSGACDLEDEEGNLISSQTLISAYPEVIDPGESGYYYEETILSDVEEIIPLKILPRPNVSKAKVDNIRFPVTDVSLSDDKYGGVKMMGRVENNTEENQSFVYVVAILLNKSNEPIGQIFTILMEDIEPGGKIGFEAGGMSLPDGINVDSIADKKVFAYPIQFQF